ncbi:trimeric intracellular cation channel family protein [Imbroritus primus]|uniref:Trimeric intracellular cation channel family protein n=1 Tax=Imbroritus primus TaxID=3058603 RepID=A0ACD3SKS1_9BURK|nr:trimeric intracellular cation channel family protein [Burkholderiaceae bacterium PBA]
MNQLNTLLQSMEILAVLAFAISGLAEARKQRLDAVGAFILAFLTAFGGGTLRDILLDRRPFYWVEHEEYVVVLFVMCLFATYVLRVVNRVVSHRVLIIADAIGLGLFSVLGTSLALEMDLPVVTSVIMGVVTGVFGGVLRDVISNEVPMIMRGTELYATCAFIGCWVYIGMQWLDVAAAWKLLGATATVVGVRLVSLRLQWQLPR